jgi:Transcription termination factor
MLTRRLIRVKVFKELFGKVVAGSESLLQAEKELIMSCDKTVDLYCFLLELPISLKKVAQEKIDSGLKKFKPTQQEANPNMRFVENKFINILENDVRFLNLCKKKGLNWEEYDSFIKKLFLSISQKDYYKEYMQKSENSIKDDLKLFQNIYTEELEDNEKLEEILEDTSVFWMDDLGYVLNVIVKNMNNIVKNEFVEIPDTFLKDDDKDYALKLLTQSMVNYDEYAELVQQNVSNWDLDRLVATDLTLIVMGIAEAVYFESIPLKVTINEYVDISKYYSTPNSKTFVNGMLDKVLQKMLADGKIVKKGRGLIDN